MSKGTRRAAAFGLALALVCLSTAPAVAAPRAEEATGAKVFNLQGVAGQVAGFLEGWIRSIFAAGGCGLDPNGGYCSSDLSAPPDRLSSETKPRDSGPRVR